ncbi:MAG TPA: ATP-binding protein [Thermoplasmata archaeon]|nr:ATP-binding protein [Thermoplasmata archaeon]
MTLASSRSLPLVLGWGLALGAVFVLLLSSLLGPGEEPIGLTGPGFILLSAILVAVVAALLTVVMLRRLREAQEDEEAQLLLDLARGTLLLIDEGGTVRYANHRVLSLLGYTVREVVGAPLAGLVEPGSIGPLNAYLDRPRGAGELPALDIRGRRKDGTSIPLQAAGYSASLHGRRLAGVHLRDMTERDELVQALADRAAELARSNRDLEQFAYVASHDLQEPLRMVGSYTQLIQKRYRGRVLDAEAGEFLGYAQEGATRMRQMIENLLAYSRLGTQGNPFRPLSLEEVFAVAIRNLQGPITASGAKVTHGKLPSIDGDFSQLVQLFQNLIANAIKFRGPGSVEIAVTAERTGSDWLIAVRDNGIGIAPEQQDKIFVIFHRLHRREEYPGSGIGLATCKKVVERHGGRIWVESTGTPGAGTTFSFTLPAGHRVGGPVAPRAPAPPASEQAEQARTLIEERLAELI